MFGTIRRIFGMEGETAADSDAVDALERALSENNHSKVLDKAARLRNHLRLHRDFVLTNKEKVRIVKALNKAKVRALMSGTSDSYSVFASLDSISSDVVQLL